MADDRDIGHDDDLGRRLIAAVHAVSGRHEGERALHAKGVGVTGTFTASGDLAELTTAAHLGAGTVPATVRFSNGSANPHGADGARDGRGMAVRLHTADGPTDLVGLTLPVFFVRTPDDFLALMAARVPDPATGELDLNKVFAFLGEHPEAQQAVELSMSAPCPASYVTTRYHGVHAFVLVDANGTRRPFRYRWEPTSIDILDDEQAASAEPDFLAAELADRLSKRPARFALVITLGTDDDDPTDPTKAWPEDRPTVVAGRLEITDVAADQDQVRELIFDPTRLVGGIECSDDQILHARAAAYAVSYEQRTL